MFLQRFKKLRLNFFIKSVKTSFSNTKAVSFLITREIVFKITKQQPTDYDKLDTDVMFRLI